MDNYAIQSYFKLLCKTYCTALNEWERIENKISKSTNFIDKINFSLDCSWWNKEVEDLRDNIYRTIQILKEEESKIIVSSKEEIKVLIYAFYERFDISNYKIINDEPQFTQILEGDKMCDEFFNAYSLNDNELMRMLKKTYFE
ncbi:MAG: hypothetical protein HFJ42_08205 [Clostridia bacterium]|nr:hypothetical protein [Clostridia bacterium]